MPDVLVSAECGSAAIDLSLPAPVQAGTAVSATVEVLGGVDSQLVDGLDLVFEFEGRDEDPHHVRREVEVAETVRIVPGEHRVLETVVDIPHSLPVTLGGTRGRVGLDSPAETIPTSDGRSPGAGIAQTSIPLVPDGGTAASRWTAATLAAAPPRSIEIRPGKRLAQVLDAVSALGFFLESAVPMPASRTGQPAAGVGPAIQEFEFSPRWGPYEAAGTLFLYPIPAADRLDVGVAFVDTDGRPVGFEQGGPEEPLADADRLTVRDSDPQTVRSDLQQLLDRRVSG